MCRVFEKSTTATYLKTTIEEQYVSHKFQVYNTRKLLKPQMLYVESLRHVPLGLCSNIIPFDRVENKGEQ